VPSTHAKPPILCFLTRLICAGAWNAYLPVLLPGRLLQWAIALRSWLSGIMCLSGSLVFG